MQYCQVSLHERTIYLLSRNQITIMEIRAERRTQLSQLWEIILLLQSCCENNCCTVRKMVEVMRQEKKSSILSMKNPTNLSTKHICSLLETSLDSSAIIVKCRRSLISASLDRRMSCAIMSRSSFWVTGEMYLISETLNSSFSARMTFKTWTTLLSGSRTSVSVTC